MREVAAPVFLLPEIKCWSDNLDAVKAGRSMPEHCHGIKVDSKTLDLDQVAMVIGLNLNFMDGQFQCQWVKAHAAKVCWGMQHLREHIGSKMPDQ